MKKDRQICISLETKTYEQLKDLAQEDIRPVSNLVRHIIKMYIRGVDAGNIKLSIYKRNDELRSM